MFQDNQVECGKLKTIEPKNPCIIDGKLVLVPIWWVQFFVSEFDGIDILQVRFTYFVIMIIGMDSQNVVSA